MNEMAELTEFIKARLDEDEVAIGPSLSTTYYCEEQNGVHLDRDRAFSEIRAKREIVKRWQRAHAEIIFHRDNGDPAESLTWARMAGELHIAVLELASVWSDYPGYRAEWAPDAYRA